MNEDKSEFNFINLQRNELSTNRELITDIISETNKTDKTSNSNKRKVSYSICPKCKVNCLVKFDNYKFKTSQCKCDNGGNNVFNFDEFCNNQNDMKDEFCQECKSPLQNEYYKCFKHNIIICEKCQGKHKNDGINELDKELMSFMCQNHNKQFFFYCQKCQKDLCEECKIEHNKKSHKIQDLKKYDFNFSNLKELKEKIDDFKEKGENNLDILKNNFNKVFSNLENYYKIIEYIKKSNESFAKYNYKEVKNHEEFSKFNKIIMKDIDKIINYWEKNRKIDELNIMYNKMEKKNPNNMNPHNTNIKSNYNNNYLNVSSTTNSQTQSNRRRLIILDDKTDDEIPDIPIIENKIKIELKLIDKIKNKKEVRIFGEQFVKNNINAKIELKNELDSYDGEIKDIINFENYNTKSIFYITISNIDNINNLSNMFNECIEIESLKISLNIDTEKIIDLSNMFLKCTSLQELIIDNIEEKYFSNVTNLSCLFANCKKLRILPDISNFKTSKVTNMSYLFADCEDINEIPNIIFNQHNSFWDTSKVVQMNGMFSKCKSLLSLPDISNWNTSNVENMSFMFCGCSKIENVSMLFNWDVSNVKDMNNMFAECSSLKKFPKFRNCQKVENASFMFYKCKELKDKIELQFNKDILSNFSYMLYDCELLNKTDLFEFLEINEFDKDDKSEMFNGSKKEKLCLIF